MLGHNNFVGERLYRARRCLCRDETHFKPAAINVCLSTSCANAVTAIAGMLPNPCLARTSLRKSTPLIGTLRTSSKLGLISGSTSTASVHEP